MKLRDRIKEFRRVPASALLPNPLNWRTHPDNQRDAFRGLLAEVGIAGAVVAYETPNGLQLIDGHLRTEEIGPHAEIPVLVLDVDESEAKKLLATFDPISDLAGVNLQSLEALLADVSTDSQAVETMLAELAESAADAVGAVLPTPGNGGDEFDATPADSGPTRTQVGDLWEIGGKHRLLVGDCTDPANVVILMENERATCIFTDPPYGVSVGAKNRLLNTVQKAGRCLTDIEDDDAPPEDLKARLLPAFQNYRQHAMSDDCTLFVCSPQGGGLSMMMMMMMMEAELPTRHIIIWKKNSPTFSMGRLDYDYQHEPILWTWGARHKKVMGGQHKTSVWEVDKPRSSADHPTMKPVELYVNAYLNHTDPNDVVADFYGGSGTAVIAAHRTNRRARVMEINPTFADVILKRAEAEGLECRRLDSVRPTSEVN